MADTRADLTIRMRISLAPCSSPEVRRLALSCVPTRGRPRTMLCYVLAHGEQSTLLVAMHGSYLQEADTSQHVSEQGVYLSTFQKPRMCQRCATEDVDHFDDVARISAKPGVSAQSLGMAQGVIGRLRAASTLAERGEGSALSCGVDKIGRVQRYFDLPCQRWHPLAMVATQRCRLLTRRLRAKRARQILVLQVRQHAASIGVLRH